MSQDKIFDCIVIGSGIVGASTAYHMAKAGYTNVAVLERGSVDRLPGSTGHAPGLLMRNSPSSTMSELAQYTADLYETLPSDHPAMIRVGGVEVTCDENRGREFDLKLEVAEQRGLTARELSHSDLLNMYSYINPEPITRAVYVEGDGVVDAVLAVQTMRRISQDLGITFFDEISVTGFVRNESHITAVETTEGSFSSDMVVLAGGFWGAHLASLMGVDIPLTPVAHPLIWTEEASVLSDMGTKEIKRPIFRDVDNLFYLREKNKGFGLGWYKHRADVPSVDSITHGEVSFPTSGFYDTLDYKLFPVLNTLQPKHEVNGIFSMTPDNKPLLGSVGGLENLCLAEAVWVTASGGVGRAVAEYVMGETPFIDFDSLSVNRFEYLNKSQWDQASFDLYDKLYQWPIKIS